MGDLCKQCRKMAARNKWDLIRTEEAQSQDILKTRCVFKDDPEDNANQFNDYLGKDQ